MPRRFSVCLKAEAPTICGRPSLAHLSAPRPATAATDALLAAAADLEARRPTSAIRARVVAPTERGVVVATFWDSADARDGYQSQPEHREALQASGLLDAMKDMRSRVFEDAELKLT